MTKHIETWRERLKYGHSMQWAMMAEIADLRAALAPAPAQPTVPAGFALVPIEPTEEMIQAACLSQSTDKFDSYDEWWNSHSSGVSERIRNLLIKDYRAMIAAAAPVAQKGEKE